MARCGSGFGFASVARKPFFVCEDTIFELVTHDIFFCAMLEKKDEDAVKKEQEMPMEIGEPKEKPALTPLSVEDLLLLVDLFYLPYNHGQKAKQIIADFKWLKFNAIKEDSQDFMELTEQEQKSKVWL